MNSGPIAVNFREGGERKLKAISPKIPVQLHGCFED